MKRLIYISSLLLILSCTKKENERKPLTIKYQEKGVEFEFNNEIDSAIYYYKKAIETEPIDIVSVESLVKVYWRNNQPKLALETLNNVPGKIQNNNSILVFKGITLEKMSKLNEAMIIYKEVVEKTSGIKYTNEDDLIDFVGYLFLQTIVGDKDKAIRKLERLKTQVTTQSEKNYIKSIEPLIRNYQGGGYNSMINN